MVLRIFSVVVVAVLPLVAAFGQTAKETDVTSPAIEQQVENSEVEMYQYSVVIREKKDTSFQDIAAPRLISRKGRETFVGLPQNGNENGDSSVPSRVFCKAMVDDVTDGVARLNLTVGRTLDVRQKENEASWTENKRCIVRNVKMGDSVTVRIAESGDSTSDFEFCVKVDRFVPNEVSP